MGEDKNQAVDEFLGDLKNNDGDAVFEPEKDKLFQNENIPADVIKEEEVVREDKPLPFHKDPKVQKYIQKEIDKALGDIPKNTEKEFIKESATDEIDDVLIRLIGNDTPEKVRAVQDFKKVLLEREEKGAERALRELENRRQAELREEQEAERELAQGFEAIEDTFNVDLTSNTPQSKKMRSEFIDFVEEIAPKDKFGEVKEYPDFEAAFKLFQNTRKPPSSSINRALASRGMTRTTDTSNTPILTDQSWKGVEKALGSIGK